MSIAAAGAGATPSSTAMLCFLGNLRLRSGGADGTSEQACEERRLMAQGVGERSQGPHAASHSSRRAALAPPGTRRALQVAVGCHSRASPLPRMQQTQGSLRHSVSHQGTRAVAPLSLCYLGRSLGVVDPLFPHRVLKSSFRSWPTCRILFDDLPPPNPPSPKPPPYREGSHEGYVHDIELYIRTEGLTRLAGSRC